MARTPLQFSIKDWRAIIIAVWREIGHDNVTIIAAGVAFFTMLAIFPLITAGLSLYGYIADPADVPATLSGISDLLPPQAWAILNNQIIAVANTPVANLGFRIALGLGAALWSSGAGIRAMMRAMNIAYGERETRGLAVFYALAGSMTLSIIIFLWLSLIIIIGVPAILALLNLDAQLTFATRRLPWIILISLFGFATALLYRIGPSRRAAKMRWILPGSIFATTMWLLISSSFSKFVAQFANYNATYGSLSAVIILLIWFWLTAFVVIVGAVINAEMERHTRVDTTRGPDRPMGARGAAVADCKLADHQHYL